MQLIQKTVELLLRLLVAVSLMVTMEKFMSRLKVRAWEHVVVEGNSKCVVAISVAL